MKPKIFKTVEVHGRVHVVCSSYSRNISIHDEANYCNTGMALCGVLKKNETLDKWKRRTHK
jgi:hypothetical protein